MNRPKLNAEQTKDLLVAAVMRLLDAKNAASISCKEIAAAAGVNHGLIHRYFGSKDALIREAVVRTNERIRRDHPDEGAVRWTFDLLRAHPEIARTLARCCLDGPADLIALAAPAERMVNTHARQIAAAMERVGAAGAVDPYVVNSAGLAALLGWVVFRPLFEAGYKLPADADEHFARLIGLIDALMSAPPT